MGLVEKLEDRRRLSPRHSAYGEMGRVEIEPEWTARRGKVDCISGVVTENELRFD